MLCLSVSLFLAFHCLPSISVPFVSALLQRFTQPGDTVLDPFLGVGTTAVAAILHGLSICPFLLFPSFSLLLFALLSVYSFGVGAAAVAALFHGQFA